MRISGKTIALFGAIALAIANLGRLPAGMLAGRSAPFTLADFVAALVWFAVLAAVFSGRARIVVDGVLSAATAFVLVAAVSTLLAIDRYNLGLDGAFEVIAFLVRWILYFGWYPFVAWCLTVDESRTAARQVNLALFAICAFGILQALFIPEFGTRIADTGLTPEWEYQGRRLVSTMLDPNFAGAMAVLALLPALARLAEGERVSPAWLLVPASAIVLSASRSSVLALAAGLGVIVLARGFRRELVRVLAVGAVLLLVFLPFVVSYGASMNKFSVDSSAAQRLVTWKRAYTLFMEHPWLGIGFNASRQAQEAQGWVFIGGADTAFDGGLLFVMVMTGVIGASLYALMLGRVLAASRRAWRDQSVSPQDRAHATATAASATAILIHAFFSNSLLLPFVMQVLWVRFGHLAHIAAGRRRTLLAVAFPVAVGVAGCSPCGVAVCETDYRLHVEGTIRHYSDGAPVSGARVDFTFSGADGTQTRSASTDSEGLFSVIASGNCCEEFVAEAVVSAPGEPSYVVPRFSLRATNRAGEALLLEPWMNRPLTRFGLLVVDAAGAPIPGAGVTFARKDGVPAVNLRSDRSTDGQGIFHMDILSDRVGEVIGTITIRHESLPAPFEREGVVIPVDYRYNRPFGYQLAVSGQPLLVAP